MNTIQKFNHTFSIFILIIACTAFIHCDDANNPVYDKGTEARLESLTVLEGSLSPEFDIDTELYSVSVPHDTDTITIIPVLPDTEASIQIDEIDANSEAETFVDIELHHPTMD